MTGTTKTENTANHKPQTGTKDNNRCRHWRGPADPGGNWPCHWECGLADVSACFKCLLNHERILLLQFLSSPLPLFAFPPTATQRESLEWFSVLPRHAVSAASACNSVASFRLCQRLNLREHARLDAMDGTGRRSSHPIYRELNPARPNMACMMGMPPTEGYSTSIASISPTSVDTDASFKNPNPPRIHAPTAHLELLPLISRFEETIG